ncbi:SDR family NAD(P)-dependent oxidoreductase [Kitasatospora arboriphila]
MTAPQTVLITGCSTGMGREAALALHRLGHRVVATARRPEALADLA